ncbi:MAG: hypothetical protein JO247_17765, partial [Chloroflexi bacterium]|nr:hypothetical protein [Chloroflexota bacterium]
MAVRVSQPVRLRGRDWLVRRLERASGGRTAFAVLALRVEGITEAAHLFGDEIADELALDVAARVALVADEVAQLSEQELGGLVPAAGLRQAIDA